MFTDCIDLHIHSTASDGSDSPADIVRMASEAGLCAIALTDRDTLDGLDEAEREAERRGILFVRGCEISTATPLPPMTVPNLTLPCPTGTLMPAP